MADETIVLKVEIERLKGKLGEANTAIASYEQKADTTIGRMVKNFERQADAIGKSPMQRALAQQAEALKRAGEGPYADRLRTSFAKINAEQERLAAGSSNLGARLREAIQNPLQAAGNAAESFVSKFGTIGIVAGGVALAIGTVAKAGWDFAKSLGAMGDQIGDTAVRMGLTIRQEEAFRFAMNRAGGDMGQLESIMRLLSNEIEGGGENLSKMGVRFRDVRTGALRPMYETILELSAKLGGMTEVTTRNAAATKVMGRGALAVLPDLLELAEGVKVFEGKHVGWYQADVTKSDEFRKKVADIEADWERAKLAFKQPIVATILFMIKTLTPGAGNQPEPFYADTFADKLRHFLTTGQWEGTRLPSPPAVTPGYAEKLMQPPSIAANDAAVRARLQSTTEEQLSAAKKKLDELGKGLPTGVMYSAERFSEYDKQKQIVTVLQARIEATKKLTQASETFAKALQEQLKGETKRRWELFGTGVDRMEQDTELQAKANEEISARRVKAFDESEQTIIKTIQAREDFETGQLETSRDRQLRQVEMVNARTVEQKIGVEGRKAQIEEEYLEKSLLRNIDVLQRRTEVDIQEAQRGITEQNTLDMIRYAKEQELQQKINVLKGVASKEIATIQDNATIRTTQLMQDQYQKTFDSLKSDFEGLFDAAFSGARSFWDAMKRMAYSIFLTPVKEYLGNMFASFFMGGGGGAAGGGGGSTWRGLLGLGAGAAGIGGTGAGTGLPGMMPGWEGSTGAGGGSGGAGSLFSMGGLASRWGAFKGGLASLGNIGRPVGVSTGSSVGSSYGGAGYGGATGGAMLLGGGALAAAGLMRGGWSGLGMTTAGGALIGLKFGGPVGAVIGAGIGFVAGLIRLGHKSPEETVRGKIKSLYGVDIQTKSILQQIVAIAKQTYGGNFDVAIRGDTVKEMVEMYAQQTDQKFLGQSTSVQAASMTQSGGMLYQNPVYNNGVPSYLSGSLPTYGAVAGGASTGPITLNVTFSLDGKATTSAIQGETINVIKSVPRLIQAASQKAVASSSGRRESAALLMAPGTVLS